MRWITLLAIVVVPCAFADTISGTVVSVIDGDTLVVQDAAKKRYTIRLAEIDAPESSQPFWLQSSRSLASLCHGKSAQVEWTERDAKKRYIGLVTCDGKDASAEQLKRGMARVSPKSTTPTSGLYELEGYARVRRIGLWADD
jgi:endonuclease YncB( thermonuclease family)